VTDYDFVTKYHFDQDMNSRYSGNLNGTIWEGVILKDITIQPNDFVTSQIDTHPLNGTIYNQLIDIVKDESLDGNPILAYSVGNTELDFKNYSPDQILIGTRIMAQDPNNVLHYTTTINHYERPQWVYFGIGVLLSSLAMFLILKSGTLNSNDNEKRQKS
jgi:hypothetical protein